MTATAAEAAKFQERTKELADYLDLLKAYLRDHLAHRKCDSPQGLRKA